MTIKFVCGCGKHLRAHDSMARVRILCPSCGMLVGVPSLEPDVVGGQRATMPRERIRQTRNGPPPPEAVAADAIIRQVLAAPKAAGKRVRLYSGKGPRPVSTRRLEQHWYESLVYPVSAWRLCLALAVGLTVLSAGLLVWMPAQVDTTGGDGGAWVFLGGVAVALLIAGLPCAFLERVLASAASGEVDYIVWSGQVFMTFVTAGARWLGAFLAGPVVLVAVGWLYWQRCDDSLLDKLILAEIGIVAVAYFILALAAVAERGRWRDLSPLAAADLAHRLGRRLPAIVAAAAGVLVLGLLMLTGVAEVHRGEFKGWLVLTGGWFVGVFAGTFFARLLGVWCYRTRPV